jgi:tripartite-type tricarboxylate transporter receptor subunit TctC
MSYARLTLLMALLLLPWTQARADVEDFYRGKTVNLVVGYGPGGGYDLFARLLSRYMGAHIPGRPAIVVQNMPGAASLRATNYLAVTAPKDGSVIAAFDRNMPLIATIGGNANVQFDPLKLTWLGTLSDSSEDAFVLWIRKRPDVRSIEDLRRPGGPVLTVGVTTAGATDHDVAVLLKQVLGLNLKIVPGYPDSNAVGLAVESGELDSQFINYITAKITKPAWADPSGRMQVLMQFARKTRHPDLPDAPTALELARTAEATQMIQMAELPYVVARPYAAPPGIPADRAEALRAAFMATTRDPEFIAEARKLKLELSPLDAQQTFAAVQALGQSPQDLRMRLREILYDTTKK